jgi:hypothetical protein
VTEGFFFAQQTHRGEERKIRTAQAVAMPQGAARWTTRAGGGLAGGLVKDTEQCREVELSAMAVLEAFWTDEGGAPYERHHSTSRGDDCVAVLPRSAKSRVGLGNVVDGRTNAMQIGRALKPLDRTAPSIATSQDRQVIERIGYTPTMHR